MLRKNPIATYDGINAASVRVPRFDKAENAPLTSAFGASQIEETAAGHFYSDSQIMASAKEPMIDMCRTEDHDGFSDHIISTHMSEFGEIDD